MVTMIIIRHGYSVTNREKRFTGQMDVPLDAVGVVQAQNTAKYILDTYKVDRIYASDLSRAYETARPLAEALGLEIVRRRDLREADVGIWQGKPIAEVQAEYAESFAAYKENPGLYAFEGGESYAGVVARAARAFAEIAAENEGKTVVVATHGGIVRAIRTAWDRVPLEKMKDIPHVPNASITVAEYDRGAVRWKTVGYDGHLEDKTTEEGVK
ncbi:MAG: histidine phosphatase family protein [Clostridia bacterium]|nr:histidine phosphatase family protein [Clostridia bacterium]